MPTIKQKLAVSKLVENHGNISKSMVQAGYTLAAAKNPSNLTNSKGFKELLEDPKYGLPDSHLIKKNREFLDSKRIKQTFKKGELIETEEFTDPSAVRALDIAYKVKGKYHEAEVNIGEINVQINEY